VTQCLNFALLYTISATLTDRMTDL